MKFQGGEKMRLNIKKGSKSNKDRIFLVTTAELEAFSIFKLALLTNQLAINELIVNGAKITATGRFFLKESIIEAIEDAEHRIDWALEENLPKIKAWCKKYHLKFETIEPELKRIIQARINDYV